MRAIYLKYDNMHTNVIINVFICINNHVNSCIKCMLSVTFQGLNDVAYLVKLLTRAPLPSTLRGFTGLMGEMLGRVVDVKHMSGSHR